MSGRLAKQLVSDRALRDAARGSFDRRLAQVRQDIDERGVGGRVADRIGGEASAILDEAVEVADSHRAVIAGTFAAMAIWIFRNPIIALVEGLAGKKGKEEASNEQD